LVSGFDFEKKDLYGVEIEMAMLVVTIIKTLGAITLNKAP